MHRLNLEFIEKNLKKYKIEPERVLDIGSLDVNGNPRYLFDCEYTGVDIVEGKNVDKVLDATTEDLWMQMQKGDEFYKANKFDIVLCLNTMEHMEYFWDFPRELHSLCNKGTYFFLSVPTIGFPEHHKPDYWRFTEQAVREVIMEGFEILEYEEVPTKPNKNYMINCLGRKL